jgi:hypothetical protein
MTATFCFDAKKNICLETRVLLRYVVSMGLVILSVCADALPRRLHLSLLVPMVDLWKRFLGFVFTMTAACGSISGKCNKERRKDTPTIDDDVASPL